MQHKLNIFGSGDQKQQYFPKKSLQLFGSNNTRISQQPINKQVISTKKQNFRQQIRRKIKQNTIKSMRTQMLTKNQADEFFIFLKVHSEQLQINEENIETLINCITNHMHNAEFVIKVYDQKIRVHKQLAKILIHQNQGLTTKAKATLVRGLVFFTYYCSNVSCEIASQNFIDFSIKQISRLNIDNDDQIRYLRYLISLFLNISSVGDQNINHFLMENNFINIICQKVNCIFDLRNQIMQNQKAYQNANLNSNNQSELAKPSQSATKLIQKDLIDVYQTFLELLRNLCMEKDKPTNFIQRIVTFLVLNDFPKHHNRPELFQLLTQIFKDRQNIDLLISNLEFTQWYGLLVDIFQNDHCLYQKNIRAFSSQQKQAYFHFLNNLLVIQQLETESEFFQNYFKLLIKNIYLSEFLIQSVQCSQNKYVKAAVKIYQAISSLQGVSDKDLLSVEPSRKQEDLIRIFTSQKYLCYFGTGPSVIRTLTNLLSKNSKILIMMMELNLYDSIMIFFQTQSFQTKSPQNIVLVLELLTVMIDCEWQLHPQRKNQIAKLIYQEGLIKQIEKMQNHQNRQVFTKTEVFLKYTETFL